MCVVPVILRRKLSGKEIINTFAILDCCSQETFIKEDLVTVLGVNDLRTSVTINTINGDRKFLSFVVTDLEVCTAVPKLKRILVNLPNDV